MNNWISISLPVTQAVTSLILSLSLYKEFMLYFHTCGLA